MFTWGSKYLFAVSVAALLGAALYGLISGGDVVGVTSAGYKGGVGDHTGYTTLVTIGVVSFGLGALNLAIRDGDAEEAAARVGANHALTVSTPKTPSFWGPLTAFGVACLIVGIAVSQAFVVLGIVVFAVVTIQWAILAWSDRATGDDDVNEVIRKRVLGPLEIPMMSLLGIAVLVLGVSRVLLAVSETGATIVAALVAATIFGSALVIAKSNAPRSVISGVVAIAALALLAGGIVGAVVGEREIVYEPSADTQEDGGEGADE
ncbi:MAG: hypothetical protein GY724_26890 [Actinomycetia bacterium]|nr:hypothetical protein [Actinomycetes bacterium]MCP4226716.1 hypothetical protein [Actinomycetes bacterium]